MEEKSHMEAVERSQSSVPVTAYDEETVSSSTDLDETYSAYKQQQSHDVDPEESRQVLKLIDLYLLPLLTITYLLQYLDKASINSASVFGLQAGTHLVGQQYAWLSSLFYLGYLVAQPVAGYALQRLPLGKFIGGTVLIWGVLTITTPACTNFAGIGANRFLLGVFESVVNPGFVLIISMWYLANEQPMRLMAYYSMNGVAGIFGGLLGYAVGHITTGLPTWKYIFLILGGISIAWSIALLLLLPDLPTTARFLDARQKIVAVERVSRNRQGIKNHHFKTYQMWQCFRDPKTWILFIMSVASQFTSIILQTFGFNALQTQYMQIPGSVVQVLSLLASGFIASRFPNMRSIVMLAGNLVCVGAGGALVGLSPGPDGVTHKWQRLAAIWLCSFQSVGFSMSLTMVSSNVAGYTKKQLTGAILFVGYCIIGPQTFIASEAPLYTSAWILIGYSVKTIAVIVLYAYMYSVNKKRDREAAASGAGQASGQDQEAIEKGMQDITELDNPGFRYVL
ncbi:MFS general substrate transporter [Xylaria nigripes]|nr:MFS general substrate transporter [Xylaria nigripes]